MNRGPVAVPNLAELVDTAHAAVSEHQRARLQHPLPIVLDLRVHQTHIHTRSHTHPDMGDASTWVEPNPLAAHAPPSRSGQRLSFQCPSLTPTATTATRRIAGTVTCLRRGEAWSPKYASRHRDTHMRQEGGKVMAQQAFNPSHAKRGEQSPYPCRGRRPTTRATRHVSSGPTDRCTPHHR